jgi:hypothetical protein
MDFLGRLQENTRYQDRPQRSFSDRDRGDRGDRGGYRGDRDRGDRGGYRGDRGGYRGDRGRGPERFQDKRDRNNRNHNRKEEKGEAQSQYKPIDDRKEVEVVPIHLKKAREYRWDIRPAGCEGMSVLQVKNSGLFPYPGEPAKNTYLAVIGGLSGYRYFQKFNSS